MARQKKPFDAVQFTRESSERIARVVRAAETSLPGGSPLSFEPFVDGRKPKQIRAGTFSGSWNTGVSKVVTLTNQPTGTVTVQNLTMFLPFTATQNCIVGREGANWYLVSAINDHVKRGTFTAPWSKNASKVVTLASGPTVSALNVFVNIAGSGAKNCSVARDGTAWHLIAAECG